MSKCYYCNVDIEENGISIKLEHLDAPQLIHTRCIEKRLNAIEKLVDCEFCGDLRWTIEYYGELRHKKYCCRYMKIKEKKF